MIEDQRNIWVFDVGCEDSSCCFSPRILRPLIVDLFQNSFCLAFNNDFKNNTPLLAIKNTFVIVLPCVSRSGVTHSRRGCFFFVNAVCENIHSQKASWIYPFLTKILYSLPDCGSRYRVDINFHFVLCAHNVCICASESKKGQISPTYKVISSPRWSCAV